MNKSFNTFQEDNIDHFNMEKSSSEDLKCWYAVYTIVRHEKKVQASLCRRDIENFLPLRDFVSQWKDRKKRVQIPIFPGYLFVNISTGAADRTRLRAQGDLDAVDSTKQLSPASPHNRSLPHLNICASTGSEF